MLLLIGLGVLDSTLLHPLPPLGSSSALPTPPATSNVEERRKHVLDIITSLQFTAEESSEDTLLQQLAASDGPLVHALVLLADNDRSALLAWVESPNTGAYFSALKEALSTSFSPDLQDLRDDREELPGNRIRETLSFHDPALNKERITMLHIGNMLYEFHISPGKEEHIASLVDALSR